MAKIKGKKAPEKEGKPGRFKQLNRRPRPRATRGGEILSRINDQEEHNRKAPIHDRCRQDADL